MYENSESHPRKWVDGPRSLMARSHEVSTTSRTEAVKKLLDQNITQVTEIRGLGRGQSIGSRCDRFNAPPPQVSAASSSNQPFKAVNGRGSSDTHRPWHSKLRRGRVEFIAPWTSRLPPSQPANEFWLSIHR